MNDIFNGIDIFKYQFQKQFTCGFMFDTEYSGFDPSVLLLLKDRPAWQSGKVNGFGGRLENGESPLVTMVRECKEELGYVTRCEDWVHFHLLEHNGNLIWFYYIDFPFTNIPPRPRESETEKSVIASYSDWLKDPRLLYNLPELLPKAFNHLVSMRNARGPSHKIKTRTRS